MRRMSDNEPRMPNPIYALRTDDNGDPDILNCQICDEDADDEMGEFTLPHPVNDIVVHGAVLHSIVVHGQCGLDHGLEMA